MKLRKIFLLASVCMATFNTSSLFATDINSSTQIQQSSSEYKIIEKIVMSNLDSLFPYQTQITVGNIKRESDGEIIIEDILVISGDKNPNLSINEIITKNLDFGKNVTKDAVIKVKGLSITNLATSVANSNVVSAQINPNSLADNKGLFSVIMNNLGQNIYNLELDYDSSDKTLDFKLDSTNNNKKFFQSELELYNIDLSNIVVDSDFLASLEDAAQQANLKEFEFNLDLSELIREVSVQYLGKNYEKKPTFEVKGALGERKNQFSLNMNGKLGLSDYVDSSLVVDGVNLADTKLKDFFTDYEHILKDAYISSTKDDTNIIFEFDSNSFDKNSPLQAIFEIIGRKDIHLNINSKKDYSTGSAYNSSLNIVSKGLASLNTNYQGIVDGKLNILSYMGASSSKGMNSLYKCKNQLCISNLNINFVNHGLLEILARYTNKDPNTTPQQILGSYGALLQLMAAQQKDVFLQKVLSSFAIFLQNPQNISIHAKANKPLNQNSLLEMLVEDAENISNNNSVRNGKVNLNNNTNLKILGNIQNLFKISFDVNK
ncbi:hypothetical protein IB642_02935 [Allofrancisella guangzhouensis]|uniref:Uncharacterized protein n=1 Tax=Allofrancisella guangzhouensis TaxID=594679 RepID=A0A0A8E960_9GAMM|nr:hypothetical protein [Allofrancisella guangzhouensis]AJC48691.1 hypothetical protein SD28_03040 [Allofrancisella guangzhouensis]MBK2027921.1 hypothetical protein [Allofrancisella guangzhouensis]MBK2043972.1 hypothetical protein [Allofrancisella guangzhouensis]MBK2046367.1 hypothetical protein [Allofrancisella guangzhouensis]